jgi:hypothetical protein
MPNHGAQTRGAGKAVAAVFGEVSKLKEKNGTLIHAN